MQMKFPEKLEALRKPAVAALASAVGVVSLAGCPGDRSWDELAKSNGFGDPVTLEKNLNGSNHLLLDVMYGRCEITVRTTDPWYDDYDVTYVPNDQELSEVPHATADKLDTLPPTYGLDDCRLVK